MCGGLKDIWKKNPKDLIFQGPLTYIIIGCPYIPPTCSYSGPVNGTIIDSGSKPQLKVAAYIYTHTHWWLKYYWLFLVLYHLRSKTSLGDNSTFLGRKECLLFWEVKRDLHEYAQLTYISFGDTARDRSEVFKIDLDYDLTQLLMLS